MNILFLTQVLPFPLDAGPKVRGYYNLRYLAEKHSVTLLSFIRQSDSAEALNHLNSFCARVETVPMPRSRLLDGLAIVRSFLNGCPFLITRDEVKLMDLKIRELVQSNRYDVIHADQLWMAPYAIKAQKEAQKNGYSPKLILDQHNAVFMIPKRMAESSDSLFKKIYLARESRLMKKFERKICSQFDQVVWVTQEDQIAVNSKDNLPVNGSQKRCVIDKPSDSKNSIIPICVDPLVIGKIDPTLAPQNILFLGGMHWPPNADGVTWFVKNVLPLIIKRNPKARFIAVGKQPPDSVKSLEGYIIAPGYVEDTDEYFSSSRVFVVPLRAGGGMRVKILDAWAKEIPIVSTTIGAEGINFHSGTDILIADTPDAFSKAVCKLLTDNELASRLSQAGKITLETDYDWKKIYTAWDRVYNILSQPKNN